MSNVKRYLSPRATGRDGLSIVDDRGSVLCGASYEFLQYVSTIRSGRLPEELRTMIAYAKLNGCK